MNDKNQTNIDLSKLSGPLIAPLTNDLMFRAFMQNDERALRGLVCALLKIRYEDINRLTITNPVDLGKTIASKEFKLDLKLLLNDNTIINIELQVTDEDNWPERSLSYLCRNFDNLNRGADYENVSPAIHIGILDYTLFKDHPEFYAAYMMQNTRDSYSYTDKFAIHILDLTRIDLATAEDKKYEIDKWAALFKAGTWEEIKMLAEQNKYLDTAVVTIAKLSEEEEMRILIEAHEEALKIKRTEELRRARLEAALREKDAAIIEKDAALSEKDAALIEKDAALSEKDAALSEKDTEIARLNEIIITLEKKQ